MNILVRLITPHPITWRMWERLSRKRHVITYWRVLKSRLNIVLWNVWKF